MWCRLSSKVISKPGDDDFVCFDLGHKAVAGENPIGNRVRFPEIPDAEFIQQSEEHLVIQSREKAASIRVGDAFLGIPWHICPTVALYNEATIVRDGAATGEIWKIPARGRRITV